MEKEKIRIATDGNTQEISTTLNGDANKTLVMLGYAAGILLRPALSSTIFEKYKTKMINHRNAKDDDSIYELLSAELLGESPYHYTEGDMKGLNLEDVRLLHRQILKNAQGTVFITIPSETLKETKDEIFNILMKVPPLQAYDYDTVFDKVQFQPLVKTRIYTNTKDDSQLEVGQYFKIIESGNIKDRAALMIINEILGGSDKSLLFKHLRDNDKISYAANSAYNLNHNTGKVSRLALLTKVKASSENLHKVIEEYKDCINELINTSVSNEELDKAKIKLKNYILLEIESSEGKNELISSGYNSFYGMNYQDALLDAIDKMTPEYIQELSKHYLTQPSLYSIIGNKEVINSEKDYLAKLGEVIDCK